MVKMVYERLIFRCVMPLFSPWLSTQQPHARMNYLHPLGKLRCARAAIMLKNVLFFLLNREMKPAQMQHLGWKQASNTSCKDAGNKHIHWKIVAVKLLSAYMLMAKHNFKTIPCRGDSKCLCPCCWWSGAKFELFYDVVSSFSGR